MSKKKDVDTEILTDLSSDNDLIDSIFQNTAENQNQLLEAINNFYNINSSSELSTKTDISPDNIKYLLKLREYANMVMQIDKQSGNEIIAMIEEYKRLRISKSREGRKEFTRMIMSVLGSENTEKRKSLKERIFGS